jgi:hypothetical protein
MSDMLIAAPGSCRPLSKRERRVLAAILGRVCPGGFGLPSASETQALDTIGTLLTRLTPDGRFFFRFLLWLFEWFSLLLAGVWGRFSSMSAAKRDRVLESLSESRWFALRTFVKVVAVFCQMGYYADPKVHAALGYDGPRAAAAKRDEAERARAARGEEALWRLGS